jgi:hypothetical protein
MFCKNQFLDRKMPLFGCDEVRTEVFRLITEEVVKILKKAVLKNVACYLICSNRFLIYSDFYVLWEVCQYVVLMKWSPYLCIITGCME